MTKGPQATPRLLIVDDEEPILYPMRSYFEAIGWNVDCTRAAVEVEALLRGHGGYDVAVVDLCLSAEQRFEGLDLVAAIRERSPGTRVVMLTGYGSPEIEEEVLRRGASAYLQKPISLPLLAALMAGYLSEVR